jgi:surface antigen
MITGSIVLFFMTLTSCENDEMVTTTESVVEDTNAKNAARTTVTYAVTPAVGGFTTNSTSTTTLSGSCGSYTGGVIRAQVLSQSGSTFVIRISKQNGTTFSVAGTAKVKSGSVCGGLAGSTNYSILNKSVDVTINATFSKGVTHFYPVVESATGGTKYYAEPLMVYTLPTYTMSSVNGAVMGTVNGVEVRSSGTNSNGLINQNLTSVNQCTTFCNRYYSQVYGINIINPNTTQGGHANTWFNNASAKGLLAYANNGSIAPRIGDILCFSGGGLGHVAIITEVGSNQVKIAHQNGGVNWLPIGGNVNRNGNNLTVSGYTIQGWLRKP